jgi:putative lipoic acid-binding regulatory protein
MNDPEDSDPEDNDPEDDTSRPGGEETNGRAGKSDEWWVQFRELLEEETEWPTTYTFKFIGPEDDLDELKGIFEGHSAGGGGGESDLEVRSSSKGNYVSVTARLKMNSSDEVLAVYERAYEVDDVIAL